MKIAVWIAVLWGMGPALAQAQGIAPLSPEAMRAQALERGVLSFDAGARALLADPEGTTARVRARESVGVAPHLPAAYAAVARTEFRAGEFGTAVRAAVQGLEAVPRHVEASLWVRAHLLLVATVGGAAGAALFLILAALPILRPAAHDLGDALGSRVPAPARALLLAGLLLTPVALGEGALGVGLALLWLAACYASQLRRIALLVAALLLWAALHPGLEATARSMLAPVTDRDTQLALTAQRIALLPHELARLELAQADDVAALQILALAARRTGDLEGAASRYEQLLERAPNDPTVANNAANVRVALERSPDAIALYETAAKRIDSARVLFNLSQAYGQAIRLSDQEGALSLAQQLDADTVGHLIRLDGLLGGRLVVDLVPAPALFSLPAGSPLAGALAADLRRVAAPGRLGGPLAAALALALAWASGSLLSLAYERTRHCKRCGDRICTRCDRGPIAGGLCATCRGVFASNEGDPQDRLKRGHRILAARAQAERVIRLATWIVPGAIGLRGRHSFAGLGLALVFCVGAAAFALRGGVLEDPQALGGVASLLFLLIAVGAGLLYAAGLAATVFVSGRHD